MADPTLKSVHVAIKYSASDGYRSEVGIVAGPRNPKCLDPLIGLQHAHRETARILALFGRPDLAEAATKEAVQAVAEFRANQAKHQRDIAEFRASQQSTSADEPPA